jgi:starch-binding outer membrane protein, SusD/RagB family
MIRITNRVRRATALALAPIALTACELEDNLLEPQQPGVITPEAVENAGATGAVALYTGALGAVKGWACGGGNNNSQSICMYSDLLTDVWKTSDTFTQRIDMDRRIVQTNDAEVTGRYAAIQQSRGYLRDAINSLRANAPTETDRIAEMYVMLGFTELSLAEYFCNGIPLGETVGGAVKYSDPLTNTAVYTQALAHIDSALTIVTGTSANAVRVRNLASVMKGRTLVDLARFADAAAAVSAVPTSYQSIFTFQQTSGDNAIWTNHGNGASPASARYVVGDSVSLVQGVETVIRNAIPFGSANDPRVPIVGSFKSTAITGFDGNTPYVRTTMFSARETPSVIASGVDARLIEAEAKLQANDFAGMMTILNALRTAPQTLGSLAVPAMAALPVPASRTAAENVFFREKAFWQFGRGTRLGDLRRLIRQYGRTEANVFPEGGFHKSPFNFGDDVNFAVPDSEKQNPKFTGCIDRNA